MAGERILVVDDEVNIVELLKYNLKSNGYSVIYSFDGKEGLDLAKREKVDLILLDVMLPNIDGFDFLKIIKRDKNTRGIPIIMLTARSEELDKILGLEIGADDYITKPFSVRELMARIKAVLRRNKEEPSQLLEFDNFIIDFEKRELSRNGKRIEVTLKEFDLLKILLLNRGRILTRDYLLDKIWGYEYFGETRTVDVHIRNIRKKLMDEGGLQYIETVRGIGYKFKE